MNFSLINKTVVLIAKRNSGKSQMIRYLVSQQRGKFKKIFIICPTEKINNFYNELVKKEDIRDEWNEHWTEQLIDRMTIENANKPDNEASHVLLIIDDCVSDVNFHQSKSFKKLFTRGRHIKISIILTSQYIYQIPPVSRNNADFILTSQMNTQGLELLSSEYLFGNLTKKEFINMYHKKTNNYGFLVICNSCAKNNDDINEIYGCLRVPQKFIKQL
jgi:tRNA U34 5-carboxymethylaminomethyl modifying GTPase MnmE/TrmE